MGLIVVTGPPAAGKSTWVQDRAKPGDIVIDYDLLAVALTAPGASSHDHTKPVKKVAFRARNAALNEALRYLDQVDVYVIHSMPTEQTRAKYAQHNARVVVIDPGREVVMARIKAQRSPTMNAVAARWYAARAQPPATPVRTSRSW